MPSPLAMSRAACHKKIYGHENQSPGRLPPQRRADAGTIRHSSEQQQQQQHLCQQQQHLCQQQQHLCQQQQHLCQQQLVSVSCVSVSVTELHRRQVQKQCLSLLSNLATFYTLDRAFKAAPRLEDAVVAAVALHAAAPEVPRRAALVIHQLAKSPAALARLRAPAAAPAARGAGPRPSGGQARGPDPEGGAGRVLLRAAVEVARDSPQRRDVVEALFRALAAVVREVRVAGGRVLFASNSGSIVVNTLNACVVCLLDTNYVCNFLLLLYASNKSWLAGAHRRGPGAARKA